MRDGPWLITLIVKSNCQKKNARAKMLFWAKHLLRNNLIKKSNFKQVQITTSMVEILAR